LRVKKNQPEIDLECSKEETAEKQLLIMVLVVYKTIKHQELSKENFLNSKKGLEIKCKKFLTIKGLSFI
jgi:hypothetical protein